MGLDMYLNLQSRAYNPGLEHEYLAGYTHMAEREPEVHSRFWDTVQRLGLDHMVEVESPSMTVDLAGQVQLTVVYWRKANAIHAWFVDNCQDGLDACQVSDPINPEQLAHLASLCRQVLDDHDLAQDLLPPQAGFFFGSTDVDDWYFQDLVHTANKLEQVVRAALDLHQPSDWCFTYQASW